MRVAPQGIPSKLLPPGATLTPALTQGQTLESVVACVLIANKQSKYKRLARFLFVFVVFAACFRVRMCLCVSFPLPMIGQIFPDYPSHTLLLLDDCRLPWPAVPRSQRLSHRSASLRAGALWFLRFCTGENKKLPKFIAKKMAKRNERKRGDTKRAPAIKTKKKNGNTKN